MTSELRGEATKPQNIHADRPGRTLTIEWADGHQTIHEFTALRWLCPCAFCRGEAGHPGWLDSNPTLTEEQTELSDLSLTGKYALQPVWADGHSSGFYSFEHLRRECPCPEDQTRKAARANSQDESLPHQHE